jgi:hypothetical protein
MGKNINIKNKGKNFEQLIARMLKDKLGFLEARRHLEFQDEEAADGVDLVNTGAFAIQCKRFKKGVSTSKIFEIVKTDSNIPLLVSKADHAPILVTLEFEQFLDLLDGMSFEDKPYKDVHDFLE